MRKSKRERRNGNKERVQMKSSTGDEEIMIETEIAIEERGISVADVRMTKGVAATPAVMGNATINSLNLY